MRFWMLSVLGAMLFSCSQGAGGIDPADDPLCKLDEEAAARGEKIYICA